jgi:hypothetical protein
MPTVQVSKRIEHEETMTPEEHQELLQLVDRLEPADAERLQHLIELMRIRNV